MRSMAAIVLLTLAACSAAELPTGSDVPVRLPDPAASLWAGERACHLGLVRAELELLGPGFDASQLIPDDARLRVTVDGGLRLETAGVRLRVDGVEVDSRSSGEGDELDVFVGFGRGCDWITLRRIG